jgi:nucleoside-diphosphate-sugar epimerase
MYQNSETPLKEIDFSFSEEINPKYFAGAWNKLYFEQMCKFFSVCGSTKYTVIRHSNMYGPFDKYDLERSHVFGATITKVFQSEKKIIVWGKGEEKKDLLYIDDLVNFVNLAINNQEEKFELMNCGFGKAISIKDLVRKIIKHSGKDLDIEFDENKPSVYSALSLNSDYAKKKIGWKPKIDIDSGIKKTIDWYNENYS